MLVINPDECIDCGACEPECPVAAIFEEDDLPEKWSEYAEIGERLALEWPLITEQKDPMPESDKYKDVESKRELLSEDAGG